MTQLMIALDTPEACDLVPEYLISGVKWFKFDDWALLDGRYPRVSQLILDRDGQFMLDLKSYNTRDSIARIIAAAFATGPSMITVHSAPQMIEAAMTQRPSDDHKIIAVGDLTDGHFSNEGDDGVCPNADGIVCSVLRAAGIRRWFMYDGKILVCPGVYPEGWPSNNHRMTATPEEAAKAGVDFVVVGRPIYEASNPVRAARAVLAELQEHSHV